MSYTVEIKRQAKKKLQSLPRNVRLEITDKIVQLGKNPSDPTLDVKPLEGTDFYRLRIGGWRVIFARLDILRIITVEKIGPRGDVYK